MNTETKQNLLLVTAGFPYGESERSFLSTEFDHLCRRFHVCVLAMHTQESVRYPIDEGISYERYTYAPLRSVKTLRWLPQLLCAPYRAELRAICAQYRGKEQLQRSINAAAYYCNALQAMDKLRPIIKAKNIHLIYTYWCSEVTLAAVLLRREFPQLKVVTRFHGIDLYNERRHDGRQPFRCAIADGVDKLIFPCKRACSYFLHTWGQQYAQKSVTA